MPRGALPQRSLSVQIHLFLVVYSWFPSQLCHCVCKYDRIVLQNCNLLDLVTHFPRSRFLCSIPRAVIHCFIWLSNISFHCNFDTSAAPQRSSLAQCSHYVPAGTFWKGFQRFSNGNIFISTNTFNKIHSAVQWMDSNGNTCCVPLCLLVSLCPTPLWTMEGPELTTRSQKTSEPCTPLRRGQRSVISSSGFWVLFHLDSKSVDDMQWKEHFNMGEWENCNANTPRPVIVSKWS